MAVSPKQRGQWKSMPFQNLTQINFKKEGNSSRIPARVGDLGSCHRAGAREAVGPKAGVWGARELVRVCQQRTGPWTRRARATVDGPQSLAPGGPSKMTSNPWAPKRRWTLWDKSLEKSPGLLLSQWWGSHLLSPSSLSLQVSTRAPSKSQFS